MDDFTQDQNPQQAPQYGYQPIQSGPQPDPEPNWQLPDPNQNQDGNLTMPQTNPQSPSGLAQNWDLPQTQPVTNFPSSPQPQIQPHIPEPQTPKTAPFDLGEALNPAYSPGKPGIFGGIMPETPQVPEASPSADNKGAAIVEKEKISAIEKPKTMERQPLPFSAPAIETINKSEPLIKPTAGAKKSSKDPVDKTGELTRLHHLHPTDKLTSIADEEEEEFIKDVEAAHGHK